MLTNIPSSQFAMSILCVLACIYWSQQSKESSRLRQDSDLDEADNKSKGQSPSQSHQRTQSLSDKYSCHGGNSSSSLIQRKNIVDNQSVDSRNGSTVH